MNLTEEINCQPRSLRELLNELLSSCQKDKAEFSLQLNKKIVELIDILSQILEGLYFIHSQKEVHRDLKPENGHLPSSSVLTLVLFSCIHQRWKIADFGTTSEGTSQHLSPTLSSRGTAVYRGPEVIQERGYNSKSDIWAFGCIAYELFGKEKAFRGDWETVQYRGSTPKRVFRGLIWPSGDVAQLAKDLSQSCVDKTLRYSWRDRTSAKEILETLCALRIRSERIILQPLC